MPVAPAIQAFFDEPTNTVSYLVSDPARGRAAVIDPVLDYDHRTGKASAKSADAILKVAATVTPRSTGCWRRMPTPITCPGLPM